MAARRSLLHVTPLSLSSRFYLSIWRLHSEISAVTYACLALKYILFQTFIWHVSYIWSPKIPSKCTFLGLLWWPWLFVLYLHAAHVDTPHMRHANKPRARTLSDLTYFSSAAIRNLLWTFIIFYTSVQTWWCNWNAKRPHPTLQLSVIPPAPLTLMNPDTDYKPPLQTENTGPSNSISSLTLSSRNYKEARAPLQRACC